MMSVMGLLASNGWAEGSVKYRGQELVGLSADKLNRYRGSKLTMIFQEPMTSLDPLYRVGDQLAPADDPRRPEQGGGPQAVHRVARARADPRSGAAPRLLSARAGRPAPARHDRHGARQQSGRAHRRRTDDGPRRDGPGPILELLADLQKRLEMSIVFITHDLGIVRRFADRTYVMKSGEVVERATSDLFAAPKHPYTRMHARRRAARPQGAGRRRRSGGAGRQERQGHLPPQGRLPRTGRAYPARRRRRGLSVRAGETVGIVGESGSGKSTLGRAILRLQPASASSGSRTNLMPLDRSGMRPCGASSRWSSRTPSDRSRRA